MERKKYKLSDLLTIKNGRDYKHLEEGNIPVFGSGGYMLSRSSFLYDKPSILLPRKGTLSNIQYYNKGKFWTVDTCFYSIINDELCDGYYLYRYFRNLDLSRYDTGASIPSMTQKTYNKIKVFLPSLPTQQKISSILSSYDRLIENNTRRIRLLEQMAENLYKEWFVRFRFPEHEKVEMVNGLPKGWERKELFDIADITYGYAFKSNKFCSDNSLNAVVRIRDIQNNSTETYTDESCDERYLIVRNALLIGMDGIFHMCLWNGERAYLNQRVVMLNSKYNDMCNYLLYFAIRPQIKYWEQVIVGTTVAHLGDKHLKKIKVLIPDTNTLRVANKLIESAMKEINDLQQQIQLLTRQRDLLLPRLMSGKLDVKS